jgi:hypothetical protein
LFSNKDDGFVRGVVYPDGPWKPDSGLGFIEFISVLLIQMAGSNLIQLGIQRGSIWQGNGDPSTPGYPSIPFAPR